MSSATSRTHTSRSYKSKNETRIIRVITAIIFTVGVMATLVYPLYQEGTSEQEGIGEVSTDDIHAPYTLTYESEILTQNAKDLAVATVSQVYHPVDPKIARQQIERLQTILNYINLVRLDNYATRDQKIEDIAKIPEHDLDQNSIATLIDISASEWQLVQQEAVIVLEQVMRNTILEGEAEEAVAQIPRMVSYTLSVELATTLAELVSPLVVANSLYNEDATEEAFEIARENVPPVTITYVSGQTIISQGELISPLTWEALANYNLLQTSDTTRDMISAGLTALIISIMFVAFLDAQKETPSISNIGFLLILFSFLLYLIIGRIIVPDHTVLPYVYPVAGFALAVSGIYSPMIGLVSGSFLSILTAYNLPLDLDLTLYYLLTSMIGVFTLGSGRRISAFFNAGFLITIIGTAITLAYRLPTPSSDWLGILTLAFASFINGIGAASISLLLRFVFGKVLGIVTPLDLLDLSRPDHPLLRTLMRNAPGTYQHSLQVANLAEQAAEAIGADPILTRVGALFHDIGKSATPQYFIENQIPGQGNPHDNLTPLQSSKTIQNHVIRGVELAKEYRLPRQLQEFIREHHGTMITRYQYVQAAQAAESPELVDKKLFQYPGPAPMSRETALVMLADGCEARFRAELPQDEESLRQMIKSQIDHGRKSDQLIHTNLTLMDLEIIQESFVRSLKNNQHMRIKYPSLEEGSSEEENE